MLIDMEGEIENIIMNELVSLNRPDLFRKPLVGFSSATDKKYDELKNIIGEWHMSPKELLNDAESVISYFIPFTKQVSLGPKQAKYASELWAETYVIINSYFDVINAAIVKYLVEQKYSARAVEATHTYNLKNMQSIWSHKSAAFIAGIGTFGANRILITEKGSAGRCCTVFTSAALQKEKTDLDKKCIAYSGGSCKLCFNICPVRALEANTFNKFACQYVCETNKEKNKSGAGICGKCISVCPVSYIE